MGTDQLTDERARLVDRVRKLFAQANATTFEAEREAFEARAVRLMTEHQIQEAELRDAGPIECREVVLSGWGNALSGATALWTWVAATMRCKVVYRVNRGGRRSDRTLLVYGQPSDIDLVAALVEHLLRQMKTDIARDAPSSRKTYSLAWATQAVGKLKAAQVLVASDCRLPVPTNTQAEEACFAQGKPRTEKARLTDVASSAAGATAGLMADIMQKGLT